MAHRLPLLQSLAYREGTWERINRAIRERLRVRLRGGILSPARAHRGFPEEVKTTGVVGAEDRAYDGGKKVKGLKSVTCWWTPRGLRAEGEGHEREGHGLRRDQDATAGGG